MAEDTKKWNFNVTKSAMNVGKKLKMVEQISKDTLEKRHSSPIRKVYYNYILVFMLIKKFIKQGIHFFFHNFPSIFPDIIPGRGFE